jgi:hypothetical protein
MTRLSILAILISIPLLGSAQAPSVQREITLGCGACAAASQFSEIQAVAVGSSGEILVADRDAPALRRFDATGKSLWSGGTRGSGPGEYQLIFHATFLPNGGVAVVDMTSRRVTTLAPDHRVASTTQLSHFATTAGSDFSGNIVTAAEGPRGTLEIVRWRGGTVAPFGAQGSAALVAQNASVAISPSGVVAAFVNGAEYRIVRFDSAGTRLPDLTRSIERVRRTNEEEAELRARAARGAAMVAAELRGRGGNPRPTPAFPESERSLKPHAATDGIRYDPSGRLWVRTMRGDGASTVFDIFSPAGTFSGSLTLPVAVKVFALGGNYLVTASDNDDGIPEVIRWRVK